MKQMIKIFFAMAVLTCTSAFAQDVLLLMDDAVVPPMHNAALANHDELTLTDRFEASLQEGNIYVSLFIALLAGFLTSLSPCIYPIIPITLSVLGARRAKNHLHGFLRALVYVLGMAALYTTLGATFASLGIMLGGIMQHPAFLMIMALFFGFMAFSSLGFFSLALPQSMVKKLTTISSNGYKGAFLMGLFAGILAAPCTGPVLGVILGLIASAKSVAFGALLMFVFSLGLGAPFLILGTFSQAISRMPRSGDWMNNVKNIFGAGMLFAALYYAALALPVLRRLLTLLNGFSLNALLLFLGLSILMLAVHRKSASTLSKTIQNVVGAFLFAIITASLLLPTPHQPTTQLNRDNLTWHVIDARTTDPLAFDRVLDSARELGRPILIDFYADWCVACVQFDKITFVDPAIAEALQQFTLIRVDATTQSTYLTQLQNRYQVIGLPYIAVIDRRGETRKIQGFLPPNAMMPILTHALSTGN